MNKGYNNNPNLPKEDYRHAFSQQEIDEFVKCADDPVYFATTYMRIINVDRGLMPFEMWDFQREMLKTFHENRFSICKLPRQVGKTTTSVAFLLHYILFNENVNCAILANSKVSKNGTKVQSNWPTVQEQLQTPHLVALFVVVLSMSFSLTSLRSCLTILPKRSLCQLILRFLLVTARRLS